MKSGPDIAVVAALLGDPGRANMLSALIGGGALTAGELAREAGVTAQTASSHLARLTAGGLIVQRPQGRHRYYALSGDDVAAVLEGLMGLAARTGHSRARTGPKEPALRRARVCYNHLAGDLGVAMLDGLKAQGLLAGDGGSLSFTQAGAAFSWSFGLAPLIGGARRPVCRECLDWSVRRSHLAGPLGVALLQRIYALGWASRAPEGRAVIFTPEGRLEFGRVFGVAEEV